MIRELFYDVRLKWFDLGIELKVNMEELDVVKLKNGNDPGVCFREMLRIWLKIIDNPPTWKAMADALTAKAINELGLAKKGNIHVLVYQRNPKHFHWLYSCIAAILLGPVGGPVYVTRRANS